MLKTLEQNKTLLDIALDNFAYYKREFEDFRKMMQTSYRNDRYDDDDTDMIGVFDLEDLRMEFTSYCSDSYNNNGIFPKDASLYSPSQIEELAKYCRYDDVEDFLRSEHDIKGCAEEYVIDRLFRRLCN